MGAEEATELFLLPISEPSPGAEDGVGERGSGLVKADACARAVLSAQWPWGRSAGRQRAPVPTPSCAGGPSASWSTCGGPAWNGVQY